MWHLLFQNDNENTLGDYTFPSNFSKQIRRPKNNPRCLIMKLDDNVQKPEKIKVTRNEENGLRIGKHTGDCEYLILNPHISEKIGQLRRQNGAQVKCSIDLEDYTSEDINVELVDHHLTVKGKRQMSLDKDTLKCEFDTRTNQLTISADYSTQSIKDQPRTLSINNYRENVI
ncbi:hypothetical protein SNEBB_003356 [Seison nebaliae]|nr:hypothetical protein SNEBB_003356 [Seison nebaliae]